MKAGATALVPVSVSVGPTHVANVYASVVVEEMCNAGAVVVRFDPGIIIGNWTVRRVAVPADRLIVVAEGKGEPLEQMRMEVL